MKKKTFKGEVLAGHKQDAIWVPFDPSIEWGIEAQRLWRGRHGFPVRGTIGGTSFESAIVPRQKKFYLLIEVKSGRAAAVAEDVSTICVSGWINYLLC